MTTELTFSNKCWAQKGNTKYISGWRHIHALANMEGLLMGIAAAQRIRGFLTVEDSCKIAFTGIEFVRAGYGNVLAMSESCNKIAKRIEELALKIDEREWIWAVDYESGAWQLQHGDDDETGSICFEGVMYQLVPHRSTSIDASVYVQVDVSGNGHFEIVEHHTGKRLAILAAMNVARHIASYAVSIHGGYGAVLIRETSESPTHASFDEWLID